MAKQIEANIVMYPTRRLRIVSVGIDLAAFIRERNRNRIARDAGFRARHQALFAQKRVDERRFSDIRAPDNCNPQGPQRPFIRWRSFDGLLLRGGCLQSLGKLIKKFKTCKIVGNMGRYNERRMDTAGRWPPP